LPANYLIIWFPPNTLIPQVVRPSGETYGRHNTRWWVSCQLLCFHRLSSLLTHGRCVIWFPPNTRLRKLHFSGRALSSQGGDSTLNTLAVGVRNAPLTPAWFKLTKRLSDCQAKVRCNSQSCPLRGVEL